MQPLAVLKIFLLYEKADKFKFAFIRFFSSVVCAEVNPVIFPIENVNHCCVFVFIFSAKCKSSIYLGRVSVYIFHVKLIDNISG